ncbi:MAG: hypothetical protein ACRDN9_18220 [Streptosporangiaceae bacterium]
MNGSTQDPTQALLDAVRDSLADLNAYPVCDMTDDLEMAETIGRLKSLAGMLVTITSH